MFWSTLHVAYIEYINTETFFLSILAFQFSGSSLYLQTKIAMMLYWYDMDSLSIKLYFIVWRLLGSWKGKPLKKSMKTSGEFWITILKRDFSSVDGEIKMRECQTPQIDFFEANCEFFWRSKKNTTWNFVVKPGTIRFDKKWPPRLDKPLRWGSNETLWKGDLWKKHHETYLSLRKPWKSDKYWMEEIGGQRFFVRSWTIAPVKLTELGCYLRVLALDFWSTYVS